MTTYTISHLAGPTQISTRTLCHYDNIDLLKAVQIKDNGYRHHDKAEKLQLQRILLLKDARTSLADIKATMCKNDHNIDIQSVKSISVLFKVEQDHLAALALGLSL